MRTRHRRYGGLSFDASYDPNYDPIGATDAVDANYGLKKNGFDRVFEP